MNVSTNNCQVKSNLFAPNKGEDRKQKTGSRRKNKKNNQKEERRKIEKIEKKKKEDMSLDAQCTMPFVDVLSA